MPVLIKAIQSSKGPVLELGTGLYSTPLMHWLCFDEKRPLVSYEHDPKYFKYNHQYTADFHKVILVEEWSKININDTFWSVVLIDTDADGSVRKEMVKTVANNAQYIVMHDTNPYLDSHYHYSEVFPLFKFRFNYTKASPNTSIVSNFVDVSNFII